MTKYCKSCGRQLENEDRFCDVCGKPSPLTPMIETAGKEQSKDAAQATPVPNKPVAMRTTEERAIAPGGVWRRKLHPPISPHTEPATSLTPGVAASSQEKTETTTKPTTAPGIEPPHVNPAIALAAVFLLMLLMLALVYAHASALVLLGVTFGGIFAIVFSIPLYLRHASGGRIVRRRSYLICPECNVRIDAGRALVHRNYSYYRRDPERHATSVLRWHLVNVHHYAREDARRTAAKAEFMHDDK